MPPRTDNKKLSLEPVETIINELLTDYDVESIVVQIEAKELKKVHAVIISK